VRPFKHMKNFESQAGQALRAHVPVGARLLVAVSGGPDSVALAHMLRGQPYSLVIGHINHRLRQGSARDARFVQRLARAWDIPFRSKTIDVKAYAKTHRLGIEEAARNVRYRALTAMAGQERCAAIVTAHTASDQAETVLMNFLRGSGATGLAGMPAARKSSGEKGIPILRPLLGLTRSRIMQYLSRHALAFRQDPSNRSLRFARNRIRHMTLPSLEKRYPGLSSRMVQTADILRVEEEFWRALVLRELPKTVRKDGQRIAVVLPRLLRYHKALSRRILRHILPGLSFQDIEQVLALARSPGSSGGLKLSGPWSVRRRAHTLVAVRKRNG